ncbi:hypothetical protein OJE16_08285 [Pantoea tagorei]
MSDANGDRLKPARKKTRPSTAQKLKLKKQKKIETAALSHSAGETKKIPEVFP